MSLEYDGWTMLFFDKCAGSYNFNNPFTIGVTLQDLFASDAEQLVGIAAINEFNKALRTDKIPTDLDESLFQVFMFITTYGKNNIAKYTVIGVNNELLKLFVTTNGKIPNNQFLITLCRYHNAYIQFGNKNNVITKTSDVKNDETTIVKKILATVGDITDQMIDHPTFLTCKLYDYQKRSIYWMLQREMDTKTVIFNIHDEVIIGEIFFDIRRQLFTVETDRKKLHFNGGALIDEVGLGKTIQITTLALLNPSPYAHYIVPSINRFYSRATLVLCPNQLSNQWKRELEKMISATKNLKIVMILTKVHFDKCTYNDLLTADFVITSFNFFDNKVFLSQWISKISQSKTYHRSSRETFNLVSVKLLFEKMASELMSDPTTINNVNPLIPLIYWHRIIVDEFHEIFTVSKYAHMINILPTIESKFRWCVTGTPFDKGNECLLEMTNFVTNYGNPYADRILKVNAITDYLSTNFFRRNTKKSVYDEYRLPAPKETVVWLKFTQTERMMYNAYLANPNNDKYSEFLRKLCCHPKLAEEIKGALSNCKTLDDIQKIMVQHYEKAMTSAHEVVMGLENRILLSEKKIVVIERRRQKKFLTLIGYDAEIKNEKGPDNEFKVVENSNVDIDLGDKNYNNMFDIFNGNDSDDEALDKSIKVVIANKPKIVISDDNQDVIKKLVGHLLLKHKSKTIQKINEYILTVRDKLFVANKDYEGKKTTFVFYKNVFNRIKKTTTKDGNDIAAKEGEPVDDDDEETCGICLTPISGEDIGVTKCGHIFCYQCIKTIIPQKHECPYCRKHLNDNDIYMISYEKTKRTAQQTQEIKDKLALINVVGTKMANVIYYLKASQDHVIIFSQWDDLLRKIGTMLTDFGIKNVFCVGNVWQRDRAVRTFNSDSTMRVIMLSSKSAASGTNLTKANKVIIIEPVCGTYEYRKNTEGQAIGRAHRMGQQNQVEIVRFIIRDTIEEETYNINKHEDSKYIADMKIFESSDDLLTLSSDKLNELSTHLNQSKKKKIIVKGKKKSRISSDDECDEELF